MHIGQLSEAGKRIRRSNLQRSQRVGIVLRDCNFEIKRLQVEYAEVYCPSSGAKLALQ